MERLRNKGLHRAIEERNIVQTVKRRKADWIGYIWRRNCLLKYFSGGKIREELTRKEKWAAPRWPQGKEINRKQTLETSVWKSLWTCCQTVYLMMINCICSVLHNTVLIQIVTITCVLHVSACNSVILSHRNTKHLQRWIQKWSNCSPSATKFGHGETVTKIRPYLWIRPLVTLYLLNIC